MGIIDGLVGIWFIIVPFLSWGASATLWANFIGGVLAVIFGFGMVRGRPSQGWIAGVLGLWMVIAAFIPGFQQGTALYWNNIIIGVIMAFAGFTAIGGRKEPSPVAH